MTGTDASSPVKSPVIVSRAAALDVIKEMSRLARQDGQPFISMQIENVLADAERVAAWRELLVRIKALLELGPPLLMDKLEGGKEEETRAALLEEIKEALSSSRGAA